MKQKVLLVTLLFLSSSLVNWGADCSADYSTEQNVSLDILPNLTYNSYLYIDVNTTPLQTPVQFGITTTVPVTVRYTTDIPEKISLYLPSRLLNRFLFGNATASSQTIHLSIEDNPQWATISLSEEDFTVEIPFENEYKTIETNLNIFLGEDAPAAGYYLGIKAVCNKVGRVQASMLDTSIIFTPDYQPCMTITGNTTIQVNQLETKNMTITVKNCGNAKSRITAQLVNCPHEINCSITPNYQNIMVNNDSTFNLLISPSKNITGNQTIEVLFSNAKYPVEETGFNYKKNDSFFITAHIIPIKIDEESEFPLIPIVVIVILVTISLIITNRRYKLLKF